MVIPLYTGRLELGADLRIRDDEREDRKLARLRVGLELEAVGEQRLHHELFPLAGLFGRHGVELRVDGGVGLGVDVEEE